MQVIITMAGLGERFKKNGYKDPKPFIRLADGETVIDKLLYIFPKDWHFIFVVQSELDSSYKKYLKSVRKNSQIVDVSYSKRGPVDSVLAAIPYLNLKSDCLVSYCDYSLNWDPYEFLLKIKKTKSDAAIIGYTGKHPTFLSTNTYCHYTVKNDFVTAIREKKSFTKNREDGWTSCGLYYFKSGFLLKQAIQHQLDGQFRYKSGEYYTSLALKALMKHKPKIKILNYQIDHFLQLGTPFDIEQYNYWYELFYQ